MENKYIYSATYSVKAEQMILDEIEQNRPIIVKIKGSVDNIDKKFIAQLSLLYNEFNELYDDLLMIDNCKNKIYYRNDINKHITLFYELDTWTLAMRDTNIAKQFIDNYGNHMIRTYEGIKTVPNYSRQYELPCMCFTYVRKYYYTTGYSSFHVPPSPADVFDNIEFYKIEIGDKPGDKPSDNAYVRYLAVPKEIRTKKAIHKEITV